MRPKIIPIAIFLVALGLLAVGSRLIDHMIVEFVTWRYPGQLGGDVNPGDNLRYLVSIPAMRVFISLPVLAASLFVILAKRYEAKDKNWAYGAIGTLLGYWLKG